MKKDIEQAWAAMFDSERVRDPVELEKEGWRSPGIIHGIHTGPAQRMEKKCRDSGFAEKKFLVKRGDAARRLVFFRPV